MEPAVLLHWFHLRFDNLDLISMICESQVDIAVLEINYWVWSSAGPVGLKFTGPSAKLLITLIIFIFICCDPLGSTYFGSCFNSPKENR